MTLRPPDNAGITADVGSDRAVGCFCRVRERGRLGATGAADVNERLKAMGAD